MNSSVVVVGAGIMGCSMGLNLARRGCKVHIIDPKPCSGATPVSWAWLNANKKNPSHYKELNMKGMEEWSSGFPSLLHACGSILLDDLHPSTDADYPCQHLTPEQLLQLEPNLAIEAVMGRAVHLYRQEGWVDPEAACSWMLKEAERLGAELVYDTVEKLIKGAQSDGEAEKEVHPHEHVQLAASGAPCVGVRTSSGRDIASDVVVLACGTAVQGLAAQADITVPMLHKPARVALTTALQPGVLKSMLCSKDVFVMQRPDGTFMLGEPWDNTDESTAASVGSEMLARARLLLPDLSAVEVASVHVAYRPYPEDGHPIIGFAARGLYVCTTHSGMTLAPYVSKLAAQEVLSGGAWSSDDLVHYRPHRSFGSGVKAYGWDLYSPVDGQQPDQQQSEKT